MSILFKTHNSNDEGVERFVNQCHYGWPSEWKTNAKISRSVILQYSNNGNNNNDIVDRLNEWPLMVTKRKLM
jgi:hypothetical protein